MTDLHLSASLDEETARAELYGLLSELFYAPARPELLAQLRVAATDAPSAGGFLEEPWRQLVGLTRDMEDASIQNEHHTLFGGVGKPEVYVYASHFLTGFLNEKPLAQLRTDLAALGLGRDDTTMSESEDHVSYVFEVMRFLIAGEDVSVSNLTQQAQFFAAHVQTWLPALCDALQATPRARFYAAVAELTRAFIQVEAQGFDMLA